MSSDLIGVLVAAALAAAVVVLGWRRRLGRSTDEWLPRYGEGRAGGQPMQPVGHRRRGLSARERQWLPRFYLLLGVTFAAMAMLSSRDRLTSALNGAAWLIAGLVCWWRWSRNGEDAKSQAQ
jgi:hypothetical protein